jgi:hypothetical protein
MSDGPLTINYDMVTQPVQDNYAATVGYVLEQLGKAFTVHLPVLGIYNPVDLADPLIVNPVLGDRVIQFNPGSTATNNHIFEWDGAAWVDTLEAASGVAVATTQNSSVIPGYPTYLAGNTIIYSDYLDPLGTNNVLKWTMWYLNFDHDYILNNGYNPVTNVGLRHATINSWLNQSVQTTALPTFAGLTLTDNSGINILEVDGTKYMSHQFSFDTLATAYVDTVCSPGFTANNTWTLRLTISGYATGSKFSGEQYYMLASDATTYATVTPIKQTIQNTGIFIPASVSITLNGTTNILIHVGGTAALAPLASWSVRIVGVSAKP